MTKFYNMPEGQRFSVMSAIAFDYLNAQEIALLAALCSFQDVNGKCYPKYTTLADMLGKSKSWVCENMKVLEECGFIRVEVAAFNKHIFHIKYDDLKPSVSKNKREERVQHTEHRVQPAEQRVQHTELKHKHSSSSNEHNSRRGENPPLLENSDLPENKIDTQQAVPETNNAPLPAKELTLDQRLFERGTEVLGARGRGFVAKLKKHFDNDCQKALDCIELAAAKYAPMEYIGAIINKPKEPHAPHEKTADDYLDENRWCMGEEAYWAAKNIGKKP